MPNKGFLKTFPGVYLLVSTQVFNSGLAKALDSVLGRRYAPVFNSVSIDFCVGGKDAHFIGA